MPPASPSGFFAIPAGSSVICRWKLINWNDFPTYQKRGSCVVKKEYWIDKYSGCRYSEENEAILNRIGVGEDCVKKRHWVVDKEIPFFKEGSREYIEKLVNVGEE